jgi:hypothetical protein
MGENSTTVTLICPEHCEWTSAIEPGMTASAGRTAECATPHLHRKMSEVWA